MQKEFAPEDLFSDLQTSIKQKDKVLQEEILTLERTFLNSTDSIFSVSKHYSDLSEKSGMVFFIKKKDSLVFWSDNSVPVEILFEEANQQIVDPGNAYFRLLSKKTGDYTYYGLYLIRNNYNYENDYLSNEFHPSFKIATKATISETKGNNNIFGNNKEFLFSVEFHPSVGLSNYQIFTLLFVYLFAILFLLGAIYEAHYLFYRSNGLHTLFVAGYIIDVLIVRFLLHYFKLPAILYNTDLFSPKFYAYSDIIPSLGDLFLHTVFLLVISYFLFSQIKFNIRNHKRSELYKLFIIFTLFMHVFIFFKGILFLFESLIIDSNISLDLNNIFSLSPLSVISFLILSCFILSYFLVTSKLALFAFKYSRNFTTYFTLSLVVFIIFILICIARQQCDPFYQFFILLYILSFWFFFRYKNFKISLSNIVFYLLFFSIVSTYALHHNNNNKEKEYRKMIASKLSSEQRDPLAEYMFIEVHKTAVNDEKLKFFLSDYLEGSIEQDSINNYLKETYFDGYWNKFSTLITVCSSDEYLILQPENVEFKCFDYFNSTLKEKGRKTDCPELYFVNYMPGENGYVSILSYEIPFRDTSITTNIYVELTPKKDVRNLGFLDLLVNKNVDKTPDLSDYSYAKYKDGILYKRIGKYFYNTNLAHYEPLDKHQYFFDKNGYNHLLYRIDDEKVMLISRKQKTIMDILAPFSYLFLSYGLFIMLVYFIFIFPSKSQKISLTFRTRLQISLSSIILFSFIVIGVFTMYYINNLNEQKNRDILSEKTHSVFVELQHKYSGDESFFEESVMLENLFVKFADVFFTDINLFSIDGHLINSSRPQIYDEKLVSRMMNPIAYMELTVNNNSLYIHNECIGKKGYLSAYMPFVNDFGQVIAYLNLPYFAKENDLKREISSFLVAYINIYVILIALSILIALVISNYVARPIKIIVSKIREVKLLGQNEKIKWNRKDEIGKLVTEYNRMIDELAYSAELLARSERESAWREMAKQVAHEIKNPLTPMKLSVQYLERAWNSKSPDWEKRLSKFTQTMIEQIDTLSAIAGEFSDFAKMPLSKKENTNLDEIIQNTISLFKNYENIDISFKKESRDEDIVYADKEQLLRAFNNLLKNSVQAIGHKSDGKIDINIKAINQNCVIRIEDNGGGIPDELNDKIFSPNFTTKSGGMGLGLAIVKSIIVNSGGEISFQSIEQNGTVFTIKLPLVS